MNRPWTRWEESQLRRLYAQKPTRELAELFERTVCAIKSRATLLHLDKGTRRPWSAAEDQLIRKLYPHTTTPQIAKRLNRSVFMVYDRANGMRLHKTPEHRARVLKELGHHLASLHLGRRFPKGNASWNKGLRRPGWFRGRMRETQFKKGQLSGAAKQLHRPVGTVLVDDDGYLRIKIAERIDGKPPGWHPSIWPALHRHNWEKAHGPIPRGHIVIFKDLDRSNCAIENLELVTLAENMRRNTIHNKLPPDVKAAVYAKIALKRTITTLEKKNGKESNAGPAQPPVRDAGSAQGPGQADGHRSREGDLQRGRQTDRQRARRGQVHGSDRRKRRRAILRQTTAAAYQRRQQQPSA